jgi:hypothetical protein
VKHSWETPGSPVFLRIFAIAGAMSLFWVLAMLPIPLPEWLPGFVVSVSLAILALIATWVVLDAIRRRYPGFLAPPNGFRTGEGILSIAIWCIPTYLVLGALFGGAAWFLVPRTEHHWPLVVYGLAIWAPVWFCAAPATVFAWWRTRRALKVGEGRR